MQKPFCQPTFIGLMLLLLTGCGSGSNDSSPSTTPSAPAIPADQTFHLYNSLGKPITIRIESPSYPDQAPVELKANGHYSVHWFHAETLTFKVIAPEGYSAHDQTLVIAPGQSKGDILFDFGAKTIFYQYPMFYVPMNSKEKWKVSDEIQQKYPLKRLSGPKARYDLDFRAVGLNKGTPQFKQSQSGANKGEVLIAIVTEAALEMIQKGADINYVDRQ